MSSMDPSVVVVTSSSEIQPDSIIKDILEVDELPEPLRPVEGIRSYMWNISTKYYKANVNLCAMDERTIGNKEFAEAVNAVILCFDSSDSANGMSNIEQWHTYTKEFEAEVRILVCDRCRDTAALHPVNNTRPGVSKTDVLSWCIEHGFELVELNPEEPEESEFEDDFPESLGMKRVVEALKAHVWPNLTLIDAPGTTRSKKKIRSAEMNETVDKIQQAAARKAVPRNRDEIIDKLLDIAEQPSSNIENPNQNGTPSSEASFEALFEKLSTMKSKATSLPSAERKEYAKEMAFAFWRAIGGSESEIEDISSDDADEGEPSGGDDQTKT